MNTEELTKAIELAKDGKFQEAEVIYNELLSKNPEDCTLLSAVGLFYVNINNYVKAVEYFKKASEIKETFGTIASWGFAEFERKNFYEASKIFRHALELGSNADIYNKLILSLFEIHDYKQAHEYTDKMYELYPDNPRSVANLLLGLAVKNPSGQKSLELNAVFSSFKYDSYVKMAVNRGTNALIKYVENNKELMDKLKDKTQAEVKDVLKIIDNSKFINDAGKILYKASSKVLDEKLGIMQKEAKASEKKKQEKIKKQKMEEKKQAKRK